MSTAVLSEQNIDSIVAPRAICHSCGSPSGPRISLSPLEGPSCFHRNNSFPDTTSRDFTLSTISHTESQISLIDAEILSLQQSLSALQLRRADLDRYRTQQQSLFAPIRKLPEDLLQHVLLECHRFIDDGFYTVGRTSCVRALSQVCVYWRCISYRFPLLWNRLRIRDCAYDAPPEHARFTCHLIEESIKLSKAAPLSIHLEGVVAGKCTPPLDPCIQALARSSQRWEHITVDNSRIFEAAMECSTDSSFDSLVSLDISGLSRSISFPCTPSLTHLTIGKLRGLDPWISFQSAPYLTHLSLHGTLHPLISLINLPWSQITDFTCRISEDISPLLYRMQNLCTLELNGHTKISESITLSLHSLTINSYMTLGNALEEWTIPSLEVLHLEQDVDFTTVVSFLRRSRCVLRELTYAYTPHTPIGDAWKVDELQSFKSMTLRQPTVDDLRMLTRSDTLTVLPNLEILNLRYNNYASSVVSRELTSMLISRLPPLQSSNSERRADRKEKFLKTVDIILRWQLTDGDIATLKSFLGLDVVRQPGVEVRIRHGYEGDIELSV